MAGGSTCEARATLPAPLRWTEGREKPRIPGREDRWRLPTKVPGCVLPFMARLSRQLRRFPANRLPSRRRLGDSVAMRWRATFGLALCAGLAALSGCKDPRVSLSTGPREYTDSDYAQVLDRWTRSESLVVLSELDTLLTVTATFESWDFRWAYVVKYSNDYRLTVEQRRTLLEKTLAETRDSHRFYVALYGTKVRWTDLTRPNSAWIVRLIDEEGNETAPLSIELIGRPGPLEVRYFPYSNAWRNVFRIRFPTTTSDGRTTISPSARWFGLRFAGAEGNEELRWEVGEDGVKKASAAR